jgi:hypothetical protein
MIKVACTNKLERRIGQLVSLMEKNELVVKAGVAKAMACELMGLLNFL